MNTDGSTEARKQRMVWSETVSVRLIETDANGTLAVGALCDFLQEAAGNHVESLGIAVHHLREQHLMWLLSLRDFEVIDAQGRMIAAALSAWLILDMAAHRPVRLQSVFDPPGIGEATRALDAGIEKLPALDSADRDSPLIVRLSDLDANAHANNARIAEWVIEGVGRDVWQRSVIRGLDVDFLAEALHGDTVSSRAAAMPEGQFLHSLVRSGDGREIARARTRWETRLTGSASSSGG
jgi:medium-chain acyl-[acyl-carrier-protein] hydrolase